MKPLLIHFFTYLSQSLEDHSLLSLQGVPRGNHLKLQPGERGFCKTSVQGPSRDWAASPGDLRAEEGGRNRLQNPILVCNYHCYKHKEMGLGKHVEWDSAEAALIHAFIHAFSSPTGSLAEENAWSNIPLCPIPSLSWANEGPRDFYLFYMALFIL